MRKKKFMFSSEPLSGLKLPDIQPSQNEGGTWPEGQNEGGT